MTTALMMGIVSLSLYWLFAVPFYLSASPVGAAAVLVLGLLFLGRAANQSAIEMSQPSPGITTLVLAALAVAAVGFPLPYRTGPVLALVGLLGWLAYGARYPRSGALWYSLAFGGFVLIAESIVVPISLRIDSTIHYLPWLRWPLGGLLWLFGHDPAVGSDRVFVQTMRELHGFPVTTARLGLLAVRPIFIGFLLAVASSPSMRRSALRLIPLGFLVLLVYALVRYAIVITIYLYLMHRMGYEDAANRVDVFWNPWWTAITFFPVAWCFVALSPKDDRLDWLDTLLGVAQPDTRHLRTTILCVLLATSAAIASVALPEPATRKSGRVLVDEYHSNWEKTTRPFDTIWYGQESGYNYYCMYDYLSRHYRMGRIETPITSATLSNCDVLVVKIPTRRYEDNETSAILAFVRQGGGLFLIGEHTNVFGSGKYLNSIARSFGFEFRFDCLFDMKRKFEQVYRPPRLLPHPIVQNLPLFFYQVSCSIKPLSIFGEPIIIGTSLKALSVDYHSPNFYPQVIDRSDMDFGPFVEMWGRNFGKGRVLAFGDSTSFSNFCAFQPGKPDLLLASVEWLNHRNSWGWWKTVWAALALAALAMAVVLIARSARPVRAASLAIFVAAGVAPLLAFGARYLNSEICVSPMSHSPLLRIYFERQHCDYDLPIEGFVMQPTRSYDLFYQWVMRIGCFPFVAQSLDDCARGADAVVLIRPYREFTQREIEWFTAVVTAGHGLLILESPSQPGAAVQPLLRAFELSVVREGQPYRGMVRGADATSFTVESAWPIRGGEALAWGAGGEVLAAVARVGKGNVVVAAFAERFCDQDMGGVWSVKPADDLLPVYEMEYALLRATIAGKSAGVPRLVPSVQAADRQATATQATVLPTTTTTAADRTATATRPNDLPTSR
jgi:hypothetical protein